MFVIVWQKFRKIVRIEEDIPTLRLKMQAAALKKKNAV